MEYYTARDGLLQKAIDFAVLSGKDYLPCYTLYEGESGLQELKAALAEGYTPDILDTTWLTPGAGSKYLQDLRPLFANTGLEAGLLPDWNETVRLLIHPGLYPGSSIFGCAMPHRHHAAGQIHPSCCAAAKHHADERCRGRQRRRAYRLCGNSPGKHGACRNKQHCCPLLERAMHALVRSCELGADIRQTKGGARHWSSAGIQAGHLL